jgi:hypothetical protein
MQQLEREDKFLRSNKYGWNNFETEQDEFEDWNEDDAITVFDLVHRGRQLKQIKKQNALQCGKMEI